MSQNTAPEDDAYVLDQEEVALPDDVEEVEAPPPDLAISRYFQAKVTEWRAARELTYQAFERYFKDREGVTEEGDTSGVGLPRAAHGKEIHILSTLSKVRSGTAKVSDAHRANNRYPYEVTATDEKVADYALTVQMVNDRCFDEGNFWDTLDETVYAGGTYGVMMIGGPFPYKKSLTVTRGVALDEAAGELVVEQEEFSARLPRFEFIHPSDAAPDPRSKTGQDGVGFTWRQVYQAEDLEEWRDDPEYRYIDYVLDLASTTDDDAYSSERLMALRKDKRCYTGDGGIVGYHFYGLVPMKALLEWLTPEDRDKLDIDLEDPKNRRVEVLGLQLGGVCVKASINTHPGGRRPVAHSVWQRIENGFDGRSIAMDNATSAKIKNAAVRLYFQSKALALLRPKLMNPTMFLPNQSFEMKPAAVWKTQPWVQTMEQSRAAFRELEITDVSQGWLEPYQFADMQSDESTGMPKWAEGAQQSGSLNPTATGVSLIMGAATLPLKQVMQNIDRMVQDVVDAQIRWTIEYLDARVVEAWFGAEHAERWRIIQRTKSLSWLKFRAVGAENFLKKQVLFQKLGIIWNIAQANPEVAKFVRWDKFFRILFDAADLGIPAPVKSEDEVAQMLGQAQQALDAQREHEARLKAADSQTKLAVTEMKVAGDHLKEGLQGESRIEAEKRQIQRETGAGMA